MPAQRKGFTLIELMVVIAIIGILSAVGFVSFTNARISARDAKRKQDLRAVKVALELYYQKNRRYPTTTTLWQISTAAQPWIVDKGPAGDGVGAVALDTNYISGLPIDPTNSTTLLYQYYSSSAGYGSCQSGQYYFLTATLENSNDAEAFSKKQYGGCGQTPFNWGSGSPGPNAFILTADQ
jgi:prepilin-type N-terminal cleavage/methylation domain-containing protein